MTDFSILGGTTLLDLDLLQILRLDYDIGWKPFTNAE